MSFLDNFFIRSNVVISGFSKKTAKIIYPILPKMYCINYRIRLL
nr:MAG TPA: hypothetical protein [Caudoviricetes sp.]